MSHDSLNIALPTPLKLYVLKQVSEGGYSTASEYVRELIRADQKRKERDRLEALVLEGLESGGSKDMTADDWAELKRRVWDRHGKNSVG